MSANLPPEYYVAEKIFRAANTTEEKIRAIEEMIRATPATVEVQELRDAQPACMSSS